jgi:hypothetical protein
VPVSRLKRSQPTDTHHAEATRRELEEEVVAHLGSEHLGDDFLCLALTKLGPRLRQHIHAHRHGACVRATPLHDQAHTRFRV